jgi:hypothetical protein
MDDGHGDPWDARLLHQVVDETVELAHRVGDRVLRQRLRRLLLRRNVGRR